MFFVWLFFLGMSSLQAVQLSVQGHWSQKYTQFQKSQDQKLGVDVILPLHRYFEASLGYQVAHSHQVYNEAYRAELTRYGVNVNNLTIEGDEQSSSALANLFLVYPVSDLRLHVFGGLMSRYVCVKHTFVDYGCQKEDLSWNSGVGIGWKLSDWLLWKVNYHLAPSVKASLTEENLPFAEQFDQYVTSGLSWTL